MVTETITCRHCASTDIVKNGRAPNNAKQRYLCHACGRQSRENPSANGYTEERKEEILWNYPEVADSFTLRYRNLLYCSLLVISRARVA
jgi:hypothetical protein